MRHLERDGPSSKSIPFLMANNAMVSFFQLNAFMPKAFICNSAAKFNPSAKGLGD